MLDAVIILNPAAGRGRANQVISDIQTWIKRVGWKTQLMFTERSGHAEQLAVTAPDCEMMIAAGGDGTLREVLNGTMRRKGNVPALGVLPVGTGNDFARCAGIGLNLPNAFAVLEDRHTEKVDIGIAGEKFWLNVAGMGFDAVVAKRINQGFRFTTGTAAYILAVISELRRFEPIRLKIKTEEESMEMLAVLCAVANCQSYGGGMCIAPNAKVNDGKLEVVLVGDMSKAEFLRQFPKVFKGAHLGHPKVQTWQTESIEIIGPADTPVLMDGELAAPGGFRTRIIPGAISFVMPPL